MRKILLFSVLIAITQNSTASEKDSKWKNNLGIQALVGYSHYFEKEILRPSKTLDKILIGCVSYETNITYRKYLNRHLILKPYVGYSRLINSRWGNNASINLYSKFISNCVTVGSLLDYNCSNLSVGLGVTGVRIINRNVSKFRQSGYSELDMETRTFFQAQSELCYEFDFFSIGLVYKRGISYACFRMDPQIDISFNEYLANITFYPIKCYNTYRRM